MPGFELAAGDIDVNVGGGRAEMFVPRGRHPAGFGEGPLADGDHERAVLGDVEKLAGGQDAPHGMLPADQGFHRDGGPGGQVDDRLAVHDQLAVVEGVVQLGQEAGRLGRRGLAPRGGGWRCGPCRSVLALYMAASASASS